MKAPLESRMMIHPSENERLPAELRRHFTARLRPHDEPSNPLRVGAVHLGDAREMMKKIESESVALSVWSPPYHVGKSYELDQSFDDWKELLREVIRLHSWVLIPGGFVVVNIADILAFADPDMPRIQAPNLALQKSPVTRHDVIEAMKRHPEFNRYQLAEFLGCSEQTIDRRLNGNNIRGGKYSAQTRVQLVGDIVASAAYETGLYLYDRRVWVKDAAWENSKWHSSSYRSVDEFEYLYFFWKPGETRVDRNRLSADEWVQWGSRGVWNIRSVRNNRDHEAKFPIELPRRVIRLLTDPGDIVLDPFIGSGSTAVASIRESRRFLGIDLLPEYVSLAERNIAIELAQPRLI